MEWIEWYIILCLSGGITSGIVIFLPALRELREIEKEKNITHTFIQSPMLSFVVWSVMHAALLPVYTVFILLRRKLGVAAIEAITKRKYVE